MASDLFIGFNSRESRGYERLRKEEKDERF
jgi:hypothetical protein